MENDENTEGATLAHTANDAVPTKPNAKAVAKATPPKPKDAKAATAEITAALYEALKANGAEFGRLQRKYAALKLTMEDLNSLLCEFVKTDTAQLHTEKDKFNTHFDRWLGKVPVQKMLKRLQKPAVANGAPATPSVKVLMDEEKENIIAGYKQAALMLKKMNEYTAFSYFNETLTMCLKFGKRCIDNNLFTNEDGIAHFRDWSLIGQTQGSRKGWFENFLKEFE